MKERKKIKMSYFIIFSLVFFGCGETNWRTIVDKSLPELGHRNWIVIADAAYPSQYSDGIHTIVTGEDYFTVLSYVLNQIEAVPHVKPSIKVDEELKFIKKEAAPEIDRYRNQLKSVLKENPISKMPHIDIIKQLNEESKLFKILILKTNLTIPYSTVFINLDCDYWTIENEENLRKSIDEVKNNTIDHLSPKQ